MLELCVLSNSSADCELSDCHSRRLCLVIIALLICIHGVLGVHCAATMSVTHDEFWHLPVGLLSWKTGRFDFDRLNPPLVRMWAAIPLVLNSADVGRIGDDSDPRLFGDEFLERNLQRHQQFFLLGRAMVVLLSALGGVTLAVWAWELFGRWAACLVTLLWSTSPTILGHASLVTTDLGAAVFFILTFFALWKFTGQPTWRRAIVFGFVLGCAQLAKYTSLILVPLCFVMWFVIRADRKTNSEAHDESSSPQSGCLPICYRWLAALFVAGIVLNAGYLFQGSLTALGSYQFQSESGREIQTALNGLNALPVPLPYDYLLGLDKQRAVMESHHAVYLNRVWSSVGFPHYYLAAAWYKTTHLLQVLVLLAIAAALFSRAGRRQWRMQLFLLLPAVVLVGIASGTRMQIGIRYILPAFPFLMLFAGQSVTLIQRQRFPIRAIFAGIVVAAVPLSLRHHPHHLAYFNELAGGPEISFQHLCDSNLDWGQDLRRLKQYLDDNRIGEIGLAYFGTFPPAKIGIRYHIPPGKDRAPAVGWHAVSINYLVGRPHSVRLPDGTTRHTDIRDFEYFRMFEPVEKIGHSIYVFYITPIDLAKWRAAVERQHNRNQQSQN